MDLHIYRNSQDRWRDLRKAALERGAVLATNAVTIDELVERLTPGLETATVAQRWVLVEKALGLSAPGPADGAIVRYTQEALAELKGAGVRPEELRGAGSDDLAKVLEEYNRLMRASGLTDPQDRLWTAAARVREGPPWMDRFEKAVIHAIYDLNDASFALLHNLIDRLPGGGVVMLFNTTANIKPTQFAEWTWRRFIQDESLADKTFPDFVRPSGPAKDLLERLFVLDPARFTTALRADGAVQVLQCAGRYGEAEIIGDEIARLLDSGADPNDIAVVVRHIDIYGEMIEDVFTRYGVPHSFETGVPLLRIPFIKYWLAVLDLVSSDRTRDAMTRVLSSAYFEPRLSNVEPALCEIGYIDRRRASASALAARRKHSLAPMLQRFETFLDGLGKAAGRPREFLSRLQPPATLTDRDRQAWKVLSEEIEAIDGLVGEVSFERFARLASEIAGLRTIDRFSSRPAPPGIPRVRVMRPAALGYSSYRWIFAPGFTDGEIPAAARINPLLPDATVRALNAAIRPRHVMTAAARNRREPLYLFMMLDSATEGVRLTRPGSSLEGEPQPPSFYVSEILRHYESPPVEVRTSAPRRGPGSALREAARAWRNGLLSEQQARGALGDDLVRRILLERRGVERADLGSGALAVDAAWSPSELNALASCPFVFLARHRLKLRPIPTPDLETPLSELGALAHEILREFHGEPVPRSEEAARILMHDIIVRHLAPVDIYGQGLRVFMDAAAWKIRRPQLVEALLEYVKFAVEDARDGFETETEYLDAALPPAKLGAITLAGRPDHVAVRRDGGKITAIRIDDFKYSAWSGNLGRQLKESFQIPVYAYLAAKALKAEPSTSMEGRYVLLRSPSTPVVAQQMDAASMDDVRRRIEGLIEKVESGRLHADPADRQTCERCEYRRLCRIE